MVNPAQSKQAHTNLLTRLDAGLAAGIGVLALALYVRTLYPGLLPGDSGEFQALAYLLSDSHPTGYPVYLLLARLAVFLPLQDVAYRVNLFSALMAALSVALVYLAGRVLSGSRWAGLLGAAALTVSESFWSQAVIAEVYTPAAAFLAGVVLMLALWHENSKPACLFFAGLLGGLSLGVHLMVALVAPAAGVFLLLHRPRWRELWRPALLGLLAGLTLWLAAFLILDRNQGYANYFNNSILPARSAWQFSPTALDSPFERLWFGLSARQFRPFLFANPPAVMPLQWQEYRIQVGNELSLPVIALAGLGLAWLLVKKWRMGLFLLLALAGQLAFTLNYQIWDLYVFLIPGYVLLALLASAGLGALMGIFRRLSRPWATVLQPALLLAALALALQPFAPSRLNWLQSGRVSIDFDSYPGHSDAEAFHQELASVVKALPKNSILFTNWGVLYPYLYIAQVEEGRSDLYFIDPLPRDDYLHFSPSTADLIRQSLPERPIYFERYLDEVVEAGFRLIKVPVGGQIYYQVKN